MAKKSKHTVQIHFDNEKAAKGFLLWLCEAGEQDYWNWQQYREQEEKGNITATNIDYFPNGAKEFAENLEAVASCGRLDKQ